MTGKDLENGHGKDGHDNPAPLLFSHRLTLFILFFTGTSLFLVQRLNINFAIVCMVKSVPSNHSSLFHSNLGDTIDNFTQTKSSSGFRDALLSVSNNVSLLLEGVENEAEMECKNSQNEVGNGTRLSMEGQFEWSKDTQGAILGSFYYGFVFTQIIGGWISDSFGGKKAFLSTSIIFSVITLLNPLFANLGPEYLFGLRLLQGFSHGAALPCISVISVRWSDPRERAFLMGIAYGGFSFGLALTFPLSALMCETAGWEYIFYLSGTLGLLWCVAVYFLLYDWPEDHPRISPEELAFLQKNRSVQHNSAKNKPKIPWLKIAFSLPVNVVHIAHFCTLWAFQTLTMYLPMFMKEVLNMNVSSNGLYSCLPYLGMLILHMLVGRFFDFCRAKNWCSLTNLRKAFNTLGSVFPSLSLLAVVFLTCTRILGGILAISFGQAFIEFSMMGGYLFSVFDLAPRYAGILTGVANTFGVLTGFLCPAFVSYMTPNGTREEWLIVFYVAAGINMFGGIVYLLFGSCELQPWAAPPPVRNDKEMKEISQKLLSPMNLTSTAPEKDPFFPENNGKSKIHNGGS